MPKYFSLWLGLNDNFNNINLQLGIYERKRKKNIIERGIRRGNKVINVVVADLGDYYKLIHAGEFTLSKKFKKLMRDKNGI